ncbi:peptidase M50 [Thermodesulfobium narugense DSM 14796]|uniref:Peptidase M50 n=1 Tax=Thermodesulfobium narugense DSM 14796 TaxID=747365 RepID=M1E8C9_9BACT|nr:site-2 protease family protein [Thermodesulfobium narugense]AEE14865.1 peptidase M50 [Thermodesulfobium narugense DSM 14796]
MFDIVGLVLAIPAVIIALTVHEFAHAYTAYKYGDYTPKANGRLTLNPLAHIDPLGFIALLLIKFGWAKPVPVNYIILSRKKGAIEMTALAGSLANFGTALVAARILVVFYQFISVYDPLVAFFQLLIFLNISLGVFNLIPIPPLDGYTVFRKFFPYELRRTIEMYEYYGQFVLIIFLLLGGANILIPIVQFIFNLMVFA